MEKIVIFDTTLRDGEQSPGCKMDANSKILIARQLEKLGIDVIEAGFPKASGGDFEAVSEISQLISEATICALARTRKEDIEEAARALEKSKKPPRIHVFVATSDVHMKEKLGKSPEEILKMAVNSVQLAKKYVGDVEFSPEDAVRSRKDFLAKIVKATIEAGATTINIPDTVGYSVGMEYPELILYLKEKVPEISLVTLSAHCHNDLGLAVSNTLAAVEAGVRQLECCILGIGERAGNAQLEAVVMALKTRTDYYKVQVSLNAREIGKAARLVASTIGKPIPDNLPIVGKNAFAHSAGIHIDGYLKAKATYEIMKPGDVGWKGEVSPLTKHSGRHVLKIRLESIGYQPDKEFLEEVYEKFSGLADNKTYIYNDDLHMLIQEFLTEKKAKTEHLIIVKRVDYHRVDDKLSATVALSRNGIEFEASGRGDGPVSSTWSAIIKAVSRQGILPAKLELRDFNVGKGPGGAEAVGLVTLRIESNGQVGYGRGSDTDIVSAFAKALVAAINHLLQAPVEIK